MPFLIGMDEAGYGPNLGPLAVTAVAWEVPGDPRAIDLWHEFSGIVAPEGTASGRHLQIADSKTVYTPARGLAPLERGVLAALALWRGPDVPGPETYRELCRALTAEAAVNPSEPWYAEAELPLPLEPERDTAAMARFSQLLAGWRDRCQTRQIRLCSIHAALVSPESFNARTRRHDSKGRALSEISMEVLRRVWDDTAGARDEPALIIADKHGGRNRYHEFLPIVFGDRFVACREEGPASSRYAARGAEIRFETKSERHLSVALASMICKYLRELSMILFNRYWTRRLPGLKPTAGYPVDALRFRGEIAELQRELRIPDDVLWRER
jgi:ribonuclease HII